MKLEEFISDPKSRELIETVRSSPKASSTGRARTASATLRGSSTSACISGKKGADLEVLALAALLHDIARPLEDSGKVEDHALEGARIARRYLRSLGYPEDKVEAVAHAIEAHRFSRGPEPATLEAKILSDADKLDAIGAVGIARVFMYSGSMGGA